MLIRLISSSSRVVFRNSYRNVRLTAARLGGGHHDHGPVPVYVPKPGNADTGFFGSKVEPISAPTPYNPGPEDYASFFGAGVGVLLTALAIVNYTDVFKKDSHKKDSHSHPPKAPAKDASAPVEVKVEEPANEEKIEVEEKSEVTQEAKESEQPEVVEQATTEEAATPVQNEEQQKEAEASDAPKKEENAAAPSDPSPKIPEYCEYLLIGSGAAAYYASIAIRARDADAKVLMVGDESYLPYQKPPLSKELWWYGDDKSKDTLEYKALTGKRRDIYFEAPGFFVPPNELPKAEHGGVSLVSGQKVVKIDTKTKTAFLQDGTTVKFGKCLIATGGKPKALPELEKVPEIKQKVLYFRSVDDYKNLEEVCKNSKSVTVVGGGFLGSELAFSIKRKYKDLEINQVIAEKGSLAKVLPAHLCDLITNSAKDHGVNVLTETKIKTARKNGDKIEIELTGESTKKLESDYVIVAIGMEPNVDLAKSSGLEIDSKYGGLMADSELRVSPGVYCAGDNCSFFDKVLGRRRVEHWENAQIAGRLAGENMTGGEKAFWYQPSFFTKVSPKHHISAVGNTDSSLKTVTVFAQPDEKNNFERGVVFYKGANNQVIGVLLLNVFGPSIDVGRRLIEDGRPIEDFRQLSKLFPLYEVPKDDKVEDKDV